MGLSSGLFACDPEGFRAKCCWKKTVNEIGLSSREAIVGERF